MNRVLFSLLLPPLLCLGSARAESEKHFTGDHRSFFHLYSLDPSEARFHYYYQPGNSEKDGPGEFDLHHFTGKFEVPLPVDDDFYYRFGFDYEARLLDFDDVPAARTNEDSELLHKGVLSLGAGGFISDDLLLTGVGRLGVYSDFDETVDEDDFDLQGEAVLVYRINPGTQLVGGIARTQIFDDVSIYPLFGVRALSGDGKIHIGLTLPHEIRVAYNVSKDLQLYTGGWITGDEFRLDLGDSDKRFNLHVQDRRAGVGVLYWFADHVNFTLEGGVSLGGQFKLKTENAGQFDDDVDPVGYVSAGLGASL